LKAASNRDALQIAGRIRLIAPASYCVRRLGALLAPFVALIARWIRSTPLGLFASPLYLARRGISTHPANCRATIA
jgi:hypothetical protein